MKFQFDIIKVYLLALLLLFGSSFWGVVFSTIYLAGWKQLIISGLFVLSFSIARKDKVVMNVVVFTALSSIFLLVVSVLMGVRISVSLYNLFYYISWVPFFAFAALYTMNSDRELIMYTGILLLTISVLGLWVDMSSDAFSFMKLRDEVLDQTFYETHLIAKRSAFWFGASTLVMPVFAGLGALLLLYFKSGSLLILVSVFCILAMYPTGSSSAVMVTLIFLFFVFISHANKFLLLAIILLSIGVPIALESLDNIQIERVLSNSSLSSDANMGRFELWAEAGEVISQFSILDYFTGKGLGITNDNLGNVALYSHSESSFIQAFIEGGILGLMFRLLPFILIFYFIKARGDGSGVIFGYTIGVLVAYIVAPTMGNIPSQAVLGLIAGITYSKFTNKYFN
jgi:hypothetical protein